MVHRFTSIKHHLRRHHLREGTHVIFNKTQEAVSCPNCKTIQNIVVGGIIADVAPSYRSEVGRLCLECGSDKIRIWDKKTCPRCQGLMEETGEKEFWT